MCLTAGPETTAIAAKSSGEPNHYALRDNRLGDVRWPPYAPSNDAN